MSGVTEQEETDVQVPVPELLGVLLDMEGSDLHLTAGAPPVVRVHGELERVESYPPLSPRALTGMIYAILPQKLRERFEQELELDMSYSLPGRARFRVNVYQQRDSIGAAFRVIPFESAPAAVNCTACNRSVAPSFLFCPHCGGDRREHQDEIPGAVLETVEQGSVTL